MKIQPIVEGHGEIEAVPVLLRRLSELAQAYPLAVNPPIRRHVSDFFDEAQVRKMVRLAIKQDCHAILLIVDGDGEGDCPKSQAPEILGWAQAEAAGTPCALVIAYREYEAWFLASIESLRGKRGIRADAASHPHPEQPRGAKGQLEMRMKEGSSYHETADQAALSAAFDMKPAYGKCRSFRHLVKVFGELAVAGGLPLAEWPPADWQEAGHECPGLANCWRTLGAVVLARVLPKMRSGKNLKIGIDCSVTVEAGNANDMQTELQQILNDLGVQDSISVKQI